MSSSFPRPSFLFGTVSALVIAVNLLLLATFLAGIVVELDAFLIMGSFFILPPSIALAVQQYRGTFRCVPSAATTASVLLYACGGFLVLGTVMSAGEAIADSVSLRMMAPILIPMLSVAIGSIAAGRMNALWSRRLRCAVYSGAISKIERGFSLRELFLAVSVIGAMTAITSQLIRTAPPRYAENIQAADAPFRLPSGATNISYGSGFRGTIAYEFTIDEAAFRDWVDAGIGSIESQSAAVPVREITTPFQIRRYLAYTATRSGPAEVTISSGLYYSWSKEDRSVQAAFDRTTGRAYYQANYH